MGRLSNTMNHKLHYIQSEHNPESLAQFKTGYAREINEPTKTAAEIIAARDKWWLKTVDALMHEPPCYTPADEPCTELNCEVFPCTFMAWQQLKREVGQ